MSHRPSGRARAYVYSLAQEMCETDQAILVLQSLIRGCVVNKMMSYGLSLNTGIMMELRTTDPLCEKSRMEAEMMKERHHLAEEHRHEILLYVRDSILSPQFVRQCFRLSPVLKQSFH